MAIIKTPVQRSDCHSGCPQEEVSHPTGHRASDDGVWRNFCLVPPVEDPIGEACGLLPLKPSLSERLLSERKSEFKE